MNRAIRILAVAAVVYAIAWTAQFVHLRHSQASDPHAALRAPGACPECHLDENPVPGSPYRQMNFRRDIYSLCTRCHGERVSHPVDIAPRRGLTGSLPLDSDGTMTCVTCHAPHSAPHSSRQHIGRPLLSKVRDTVFPFLPSKFRTYFLRRPNTEGELCEACHAPRAIAIRPAAGRKVGTDSYAGSRSCSRCHPGKYADWKRSPHARMLRSPGTHPGALLAKFDGSKPFPPSEIAYIIGSRATQRFVSRKGDLLVVRTPIWVVREGSWNLGYWREQDWRKSCAGCHVTGYDPDLPAFAEESVGCEACHGPGRAHAESGDPSKIVHPGKLSPRRRGMICDSCHTTGHDTTGEYRFPVGYLPGSDLTKRFSGLIPKPGQDDTTFRGDGSYADRHAQFLFWASRMLAIDDETCDLCKNFRSRGVRRAEKTEPKKMRHDEYCVSCHGGGPLPPPKHHDAKGGRRAACLACHPVARDRDGAPSIHDHKYVPKEALGENDFPPAPDFRSICFVCHPSPRKGA